MTTEQTVRLNTVGVLAQKLNQPIHRTTHLLRTREHIRTAAIAGRSRLYPELAVAQLRYELNCIDARGPAVQAANTPEHAIEALSELLLDISQHEPCEPGCVRCGNEPSHTADDGQLYCEMCRGCYVDALPQADE